MGKNNKVKVIEPVNTTGRPVTSVNPKLSGGKPPVRPKQPLLLQKQADR